MRVDANPDAHRSRCRAAARRTLGALLLAVLAGCQAPQQRAAIHLDRGNAALDAANYAVALAEFREAVKLDPQWAQGHERLGMAYKASGDLPKAAGALETAVKLDPFSYVAAFELGSVYRAMQDLSRAIRAYLLAVRIKPQDFDAQFQLATCYHQTHDLDGAATHYEKALEIDDSSAFAWSNLGAVYDAKQEHYKAISAYKNSLERDEKQPVVLVNLATVYMNQDRFPAAQRVLEKALEMDAELSLAHERLGYCLWRSGQLADAAHSYLRATALDPRNARAYAGLGVVRMSQHLQQPDGAQREAAVEAWHQSLELDPHQPKLRELVAKYASPQPPPLLSLDGE